MKYRKNFAPKSRQEVAGGNDHCWIPERPKWFGREGDRIYGENYKYIFGEKPLNVWPRDENGELIG